MTVKKLALAIFFVSCPASAQYFSSPPVTINAFFTPSAGSLMTNYDRFVSDGNAAFTAFAAQIAGIGAGVTPAHAVVGFNLAACPAGWTAADGTGSTVDMRGFFPSVTNGAPANGTFTQDQIVDHGHIALGTFVNNVAAGSAKDAFAGSVAAATSKTNGTIGAVNSGGARTGTETWPANISLLYCEKT